ncbi:unnamed protein product [Lactuca virosa]|uniref:RRM domain-containing protein n=1 Tax=Lactuca virosa TaxID=75947 RepID=A0AAU9NX31_9ASTR|nr:unnamed protein product [Lactuca virosa]
MEWTEVRRRKTPARSVHVQETTYFVTNVPEQARKGEIREAFGRFGKITDVYMGDKKGKNGKYFVFVRFGEVKDVMELEAKINGMIYRGNRLEVNLAKHRKKETPKPPIAIVNRRSVQGNNAGTWNTFRDHRTFADITRDPHMPAKNSGQFVPQAPPGPRPIQLQRDDQTYHWLHKTSLIGETLTLDHLGHLPKLLRDNGETELEIKYIGGLRVLLLFGNSVDAKEFLNTENRWKEYLKWVNWSDKTDMQVKRVAWIRILGLPLYLWGDRNFTAITEHLGKTIAPYEDLPNRVDLSCPKIGILTSRKTRINDELHVGMDGKVFKIGITEFDEEWFPFRFDTSEDYYEIPDGDDEEDGEYGDEEEDGVSDTYMGNSDGEKEEGEISPELQTERDVDKPDGGKGTNAVIGDESPAKHPVDWREVIGTSEEEQRAHGEQTMVRDSMMTEHEASPIILKELNVNGNIPGRSHNTNGRRPDPCMNLSPNLNGPLYGLPPISCFGPFSSPIATNKVRGQSSEVCSSLGKRRRLERDENRRSPPLINSMAALSDLDEPPTHMASQSTVPIRIDHAPIDINRAPSEDQVFANENEPEGSSSSSIEVRKTVEIGNALGFEISSNDPILKGVMGETGDDIAPQ